MSLKLYFAPGACSLAALVALEEAGADFRRERLVLADGDQRRPEFLAVNPRGRVPALVADGQAINENVGILTYVAHRFPEAGLLPLDDLAALARAYELIGWFASGVHVAFAQVFRPERFVQNEAAYDALKDGGRAAALRGLAEIETLLSAKGPWLLGDRYSLLDAYAHVFWRWADRIGADKSAYPAFGDHAQRLLARPAVQRALAHEAGAQIAVA